MRWILDAINDVEKWWGKGTAAGKIAIVCILSDRKEKALDYLLSFNINLLDYISVRGFMHILMIMEIFGMDIVADIGRVVKLDGI